MKLSECFSSGQSFSFEVFPPKADKPIEPLLETLGRLFAFQPTFVSCTYGAGGSNKGRNLDVVRFIQSAGKCEALSHFTCVMHQRADVDEALWQYKTAGVSNLLALRGDFPAGMTHTNGDFSHADELVSYIHQREPEFCLAAACYPEKHLQADSMDADIDALLKKQDAGASFFISQLCHDVDRFSRFLDKARARGVTLPIVAGVLPTLKKDGLIRMTLTNGCSIPTELAELIGRYGDNDESFRAAGRDYTAKQLLRFLDAGAGGVHIYTLNQYDDVASVVLAAGIRDLK